MVDAVEPNGDANHHRHHGKRIEKGGEESGRQAEGQRQQHLAADPQQQAREDEQQQLFHEVDARDHEDQQEQHFKVAGDLFPHMRRAGHADQQRFNRQQAARQQRVALQRHGEGKDKLNHQQPAGDKRRHGKHQRVYD